MKRVTQEEKIGSKKKNKAKYVTFFSIKDVSQTTIKHFSAQTTKRRVQKITMEGLPEKHTYTLQCNRKMIGKGKWRNGKIGDPEQLPESP